ncbi:NAD dependent epimerase/dehydratase family protein [Cnuella takakiae]|uniref:NAD dependent epimerase/dehydratase family protein n=1 Tax=Cnuella takakiae TaxID=1302690 RepID=A0A1M5GWN7_9BACT|nr:hypothetical protein BUE76_02335 [Cnuella takakiae]SHG08141.1 NAD dependent epimerase/dehydratase family protein [Cnuella takakiae]
MKLFLTGATGYVGHRLALHAAKRGYQVQALVRNLQRNLPRHPNIRFFTGDITDAASVDRAMEGCQQVIHAAALARYYHPRASEFFRVNVGGTHHVLEAALRQGISRLVFTSTCAVLGPSYGRPVTETDTRLRPFDNDYEVSKYCAEQLVA